MHLSDPNSEFGSELPQIIEETMPVRLYKFQLSYSKLVNINGVLMRRIIYDSDWCQVQFEYYFRQFPETHELHIYYGRLHAPSEDHLMLWQGEKCYCWHGSGLLHLHFLDGISPSETLTKEHLEKMPIALEKFSVSELSNKNQYRSGVTYAFIRQSAIWNYYELKLFELFDIRHPSLWKEYTDFLKQYYELKNEYRNRKGITPFSYDPPLYKVC